MPLSNNATSLEHQFQSLTTTANDSEEAIKENIYSTDAALVTPTKQDLRHTVLDTDSLTSEESTPETCTKSKFIAHKTKHKLQEERGELEPDPLLLENPHRFVIFPIQDNDVSGSIKHGRNAYVVAVVIVCVSPHCLFV
jgi:hypothetical protein